MIPRYAHPQVAALYDKAWTYDAWWRIEQAATRAMLNSGQIPIEFAPQAWTLLTNPVQPGFELDNGVKHIDELEVVTKHDVAAFLAYMRDWWGEPHARWIHYGLTSSDIVDTAQGLRFKALAGTLNAELTQLLEQAERWLGADVPILGRTHGMAAEPTVMKARAAHWVALIQPAISQLVADTQAMRTAKISGPVGTYAHTPPEVENAVGLELGLIPLAFGGSQIVPRGSLGRWANSASELVQACAKVAIDFRLMATYGELLPFKAAGQVGSSSMAHKNNPIRAEQITGLARVAAGYASMLQPLDLWLERDISHSSVERIAVPDLWHILLHVVDQTSTLLRESDIDMWRTAHNLEENANLAYVHHTMLLNIADGMSYAEAREFALQYDIESYDLSGDIRRDFLANYPKVG